MDIRARKKRDQEEEARLNEELRSFEDDFGTAGGTDALKPKAFIRMDIVNANKSVAGKDDNKPVLYKPGSNALLNQLAKRTLPPSSMAARNTLEDAKRVAAEKARRMLEEAHKGKAGPTPAVVLPPPSATPINRPARPGANKEAQRSKTSNLDAFKEELKRTQEERDKRRGLRDHLRNTLGVDQASIDRIVPALENPYTGSTTTGIDDDLTTTNIYIGNLPLDVTMQDLFETFGTYGPLASGKILYPRPEEERKREYLCGFIAYMSRTDFDRAFKQLPGLRIKGEAVKISYAKPVNMPPTPFFVPPALQALSQPDPPTGLPFNAVPRSSDLREYLEKWKDLPKLGGTLPETERQRADFTKMMKNAVVRVVIPTDSSLLGAIHRTIEFVIREGPIFEAMLLCRERANPLFTFLSNNHHPAHVYYHWRLYSLLQGESPIKWRQERFRMFDDGPWWQPPIATNELFRTMPSQLYHSAFSVADQQASLLKLEEGDITSHGGGGGGGRRSVSPRDRSRSPSPRGERGERGGRKRAHLSRRERDSLEELLRDLTPEKEAVGDLMVWCVEHASWAKEIADCIYESLTIDETPLHKKIARLYVVSDILANCAVRGVKDVFYFRQHFEELLPKIFAALGKTLVAIDGRLRAEQFKQRVMNCFRAWEDNTIYSNDALVHCQNIFLGLVQPDEEVEEDLDGEDLDGAPVDDELDGVPLGETETASAPREYQREPVQIKMKPAFTATSWATVDEEPASKRSKWEDGDEEKREEVDDGEEMEEEERPEERRHKREKEQIFDVSESEGEEDPRESTSLPDASAAGDDERRKMMREIEVKVIALQDQMESDGDPDVKRKIEKYREELRRRMEEKLGSKKDKEKKKDKKEKKKDKEREKEKERDKEKEREKEKERDKEKERERKRSRERERSRDRDRERDRSRERRRERSRSRERRDRSRDRDRSRERDREDRHRRDRSPERRRR